MTERSLEARRAQTAAARAYNLARADNRALADPVALARAARIVRAALARGRLSLEDLTADKAGRSA